MKKKNRKQRKRRQTGRHEDRAVHAKRRAGVEKQNSGSASPPWLRILSTAAEDGQSSDASRGLFSLRNGRRQLRDLDLYIPKDNSQSR
jgi:hypothetical protein